MLQSLKLNAKLYFEFDNSTDEQHERKDIKLEFSLRTQCLKFLESLKVYHEAGFHSAHLYGDQLAYN